MAAAHAAEMHLVPRLIGEGVHRAALPGQRALRHQAVADEIVVDEDVAQADAGAGRLPADLREELTQLARRPVPPAVLVQRVEGAVPVEGAVGAAVLRLDVPPPEGPGGHAERRAREVAPVLGADRERAAQRVESEDRVGARDDVDPGDGQLGDEVPAHRVAEPVVEAHAVEVDRQADGAAGQGRGQEPTVRDVVLPRVALAAGDVDGPETAEEGVREVDRAPALDVIGREGLHVPRVLLDRDPQGGQRRRADDHDGRQRHERRLGGRRVLGGRLGRGRAGGEEHGDERRELRQSEFRQDRHGPVPGRLVG